jgi:hypothetical protein
MNDCDRENRTIGAICSHFEIVECRNGSAFEIASEYGAQAWSYASVASDNR